MRKIAISLLILFTIINYSCSLFLPDDDETGPVIVLESPSTSDIVSETVVVSATATDESGVAGTELYVDHEATGLIDTTAPYAFDWVTEGYENGSSHILYVQGWDEEDNYANSDTIVVIVDNTTAHPAPIEDLDVSFQLEGNLLIWEMSDHEKFASYSVLRSEKVSMDSALTLLTSPLAADTVYYDSTANPLVIYYYQVMVTDINSYVSVGRIVASPSPALFIPTGLTASSSDTTILLRWNDESHFEAGFIIERDAGNGYELLATVDSDLTLYLDVDLEYDKQYRYRIAAFYGGVNSEYSNIATVHSPLLFTPSNLAAMALTNSIQIGWQDNCNFEDGFRLERKAGLGWLPLAELGANVTSYVDTAMAYDISYDYRVAAFTETRQSYWANYYSIYSPLIFAPTNLSLISNDTSIILNWQDDCIFETGFIIQRGEGSVTGSGYLTIDTVGADVVTYTDFNLEEDAWYYYRVAAYVPDKRSNYSSTSGIGSPLTFAPTGLTATVLDTSIELRWTDNCIFEDGFVLERDAGSGFVILAELAENITGYLDADMAYGIVYHYRVAAIDGEDQSDYSGEISRLSPLQFAPVNLALTSNDTSIILTWEDRCIFESGFIIERGEGSAGGNGYFTIDTVGANVVTYTDFNIEEDEWYYYRVSAYTPEEQSSYSSSSSIGSPLNFAPTGLTATSVDTSIQLRWVDNSIFEDGFVLERDAGSGYVIIAELAANITGYLDVDMAYGTVYHYRVAAIDGEDQSDYSGEVSRLSPLQYDPSYLTASVSDNSVQLVWNDNCIFEEGYVLERNAGADYVQIANLAPSTTSYLDSDMSYDVTYRYRVAAYTSSDLSEYATSFSILSPLGYTPTDLNATSNDTSISLSWSDVCIFEEGFIIERDEGTGFTVLGTVASNITSFTDEALSEAVNYQYRVAAFTSDTQSDYSWSISIYSPIVFAPQNLFVTAISNSLVVRWTDLCSFEEGFSIERDAGLGFVVLDQVAANTTNYTDLDLEYGIEYRYRASAFTSEVVSNYSNITTIMSPLSFTPSSLFAYVTDNSIDLSWQDNCIFESGFHIERDLGSGFEALADVGVDVTIYSDTDLIEGVTYRYRISAFTPSDESDYSSIITVQSPISFAPLNLLAITQDNAIDLSWVDNCTFEDGFTIERDDGSGTFVEIGNLGANFTFFSDDDLEYYTIYRYRVAAYTATEQSNYTPIINVQSPVDITPSDLIVTSYDTEILLEWQDNSTAEEGFRIHRDDGSGFTQIAEVAADVTNYIDSGLSYGIEYVYRVSAFANGQESDYTDEATGSVGWLYSEWETITAATYTLGHADVPSGVFDHVLADDFEMMRYEVTNNQFAAFMEEALVAGEIFYDELVLDFRGGAVDSVVYNLAMTGGHIQWDGSAFSIDPGYELHPVVGVTWHGADAFATFYEWSLPTEAEWEVAARADTEFDYPWGNTDPDCDLANFSGCSDEMLPVGQTSGVSPFNIYDMVGNAWEWTSSFYDGANDSYVLRGGSWSNYTDNLKVWYRSEGVPAAAYNTIGFRCVR
ncbi:MAG: SUMF1/EgtB/PvdO family nonheme iron enzyme [Candidatus Marinimicrobia bacterium]|nr:SUMF1/EgtB/PvdO family nonheme iron enzyme [Candidatus Neomarinimicrobiota bacterium]